jgi:hypothetical protein
MRVFFAAGENSEHLWHPEFTDVLVSYASVVVQRNPPKNKEWFLDSGAFSFFMSHQPSSSVLQDYIAFIKGPAAGHKIYAVLDEIGDADGTWKNDTAMREAGLNPVAAIHFGEDHRLMKKYIDAGVKYVALGGYAGASVKPRVAMRWISAVFTHVRDHYQKTGELIKVHGFGMMDEAILLSYPFYSVDSTVWLISQRYGKIVLWDVNRVQLTQINPRSTDHFGPAWRDYGVPTALIDGNAVADSRELKAAWNIWNILDLTEFITEIWAKRGFVWDDAKEHQESLDKERAMLKDKYPLALDRRQPWKKETVWNSK